jgi:teichuronic acid exporter
MTNTTPSALDRSLVSGIAWTAVLRWGAQLISWAGTLYAARLLAPTDYGLISMAMIPIGLARMAQEFGLDAILVQDRSIVGKAHAQLAGLLLLLGGVLAPTYLILAPLIAHFFKEPAVAPIMMSLALLFVFDAIQVVPLAQLQRELEFRRLAIVSLVQVAVTTLALVVAVRFQLGYWSLVVSKLAGELAVTVLLLRWHPYAVAWPRPLAQLTLPLLQGWRILASRIAWYGYSNADQTIIGRFLGKDALGTYSFALTFSTLAQQEVGAIVTRVVPGIFSEVQERRDELRGYFLLLTEFLTLITFPMSIGLALTADQLIPLVLGDKWLGVITPLRLLCLYSAFLSSQMLISHVLMWTGQFRIQMWCSILAGVAMPLILLGAANYGLEGIGWAWVVLFPIVNLPAFVFAFRTIGISARHWLGALKPALVGCALMTLAVIGVRSILPSTLPPWAAATASVGTGLLMYPTVVWILFSSRVRNMITLVRMIRSPRPA